MGSKLCQNQWSVRVRQEHRVRGRLMWRVMGRGEGGCYELMMSMKPPHLHQNVIRGRMDSELTG